MANSLYKRRNKSLITYILGALVIVLVILVVWYFAGGEDQSTDEITDENVNEELNENISLISSEVSADIDYMSGTIGLMENESDSWEIITEEVVLNEGDSVKTADDSKLVASIGSTTELRLDSNSEINMESLSEDALTIDQVKGLSYHNGAHLMDAYTITAYDSEIKPEGASFVVSVDEDTEEVVVYAIDGDVEVDNATIAEGYKIMIAEGETEGVEKIGDDDLDQDFLDWNDSRNSGDEDEDEEDEELEDEDTNANENENDNENVNEEEDEEEDTNTNENENVNEDVNENENENENVNEEEDEEEVVEEPAATLNSSITSISAAGDGVSLNWSSVAGDTFKYYRIVRSETNASPTYPSDGYVFYSGNSSETSFKDSNVQTGKTYYYSVCVVDENDAVTCSGGQSATAK